jgi:hypothetical protein
MDSNKDSCSRTRSGLVRISPYIKACKSLASSLFICFGCNTICK